MKMKEMIGINEILILNILNTLYITIFKFKK